MIDNEIDEPVGTFVVADAGVVVAVQNYNGNYFEYVAPSVEIANRFIVQAFKFGFPFAVIVR